jgi:hypothetical protein
MMNCGVTCYSIFTVLLALFGGSVLGVFVMCLVQINRVDPLEIEDELLDDRDKSSHRSSTNG